MSGIPTDLILEGLVAVLLLATVVYCALLDRRLKALRSGQDGLRQIISDLNAATEQASASIAGLKDASDTIGKEIGGQLHRGRALADELELMVEAGDRIADRLGEAASRPKGTQVAPIETDALAASFADAPKRPRTDPDAADDAEDRLLQTLQRAR